MLDISMHEHVGEQLPDAETSGGYGVEGTHGGDVGIPVSLQHYGGKEYDEVYYQQVLHYGGEHLEPLGSVLCHFLN